MPYTSNPKLPRLRMEAVKKTKMKVGALDKQQNIMDTILQLSLDG
jgi:hypothetical protein